MKWYNLAENEVANPKEQKKYRDVYILDEIGGYGIYAKNFIRDIRAIESDVINLHIDSPGGSITDGIAIYNALRQHPARVDVYIDGIAASIASIVMLAGDNIYIPDNACVMLHLPMVAGLEMPNRQDMEETIEMLNQFEGALIRTYMRHTGKDEETIKGWLEAETFFFGQEAVDAGLATEVIDAVQIAAKYDPSRYNFENIHPALADGTEHKHKEVTIMETKEEVVASVEAEVAEVEAVEVEVAEEVAVEVEEVEAAEEVVNSVSEDADVELEEEVESEEEAEEEMQTALAFEQLRKEGILAISEKYDVKGDLQKVTISALADSEVSVEDFTVKVLDAVAARPVQKALEVAVEAKGDSVESLRAQLKDTSDPKQKHIISQKIKAIR